MSRILITGNKTGFVGGYLTQFFRDQGDDVFGCPRDLLLNQKGLGDYIAEINPEYIIHTASYGNMASHDNKVEILLSNEIKTLVLLEALTAINYKKFIYFSSSSVYGKPYQNMYEGDPIYPNTLYAIAKANTERIVFSYNNTLVVRPTTIIGKGDNPDHLLPKMITYSQTGKTLKLVPSPVHDYIHVDDLAEGIRLLIDRGNTGEVYNIGTGVETRNSDLVPIVEKMTKKPLTIEYIKTMYSYDSDHWSVNNNKMRDLGWEPKKSIDDAVFEMIYEKD